jgi:hypothetical protein
MKAECMLTTLLFALTVSSDPSETKEPQNAISIDVLLPVMSPVSKLCGEKSSFIPINIKYQRVLADHLVLMLKGGFNYDWGDDSKSIDIYPMAELDWHPFQKGLKGFYAGLSSFYGYEDYINSHEGSSRIALGGTLGWQFVLRSNFIIDLTFGLGYGYNVDVDVNGKKSEGFSADETIAGIFLGWGF